MDVVCDRCNTEYEFDDTLVSERGTTVKCTHCGHQFRIFRPKSDGTVARPWILKRSDGKTATFDSLAVLQRWITEGKASRADLLSRDGVDWKPLGSIAELESFFAQAEVKLRASASSKPTPPAASAQALPPSAPLRRGTTPGMPPAPPPIAPPARPSGGSAAPYGSHTAPPPSNVPSLPAPPMAPTLTAQSALRSAPPGVTKRPTPPSAPPAPSNVDPNGYSMGGVENELTTEAYEFGGDTGIMEKWGEDGKPRLSKPAVGPPPVSPRATSLSSSHATPLIDDEPPQPNHTIVAKSSGRKGLFIGGVLVATLAGGAIAAWQAVKASSGHRNTTAAQDAVSSAIESAQASARAATRAGFDDAKESLTALLLAPANRNDPRVLAARAAVLAARGESMRLRAEDLEARAARGGSDAATLRAEASIIRAGALADIERARMDAAAAEAGAARVTTAADRARFELALAEVARIVRGDLASARQHASAARAAGANTDLIDGLIARDAGEFDVAVALLRRAADSSDADARARLALARIYAARGDRAGALEQLTALLRVRPQHDDALAMQTAIEAGLPPLREGGALAQAATDAGTVSVAQRTVAVTADSGTPVAHVGASAPASSSTASTVTAAAGSSNGPFAGRSYEWLIEEGERLRARGQIERARSAFMAALGLRSDGCEAVTGLGFVEMRSGETGAAVLLFRRAIGLNNRYSDAYFGLAQAYERQSNTEQALRAYRQYLEINPGGSHAREAQARIAALDRAAHSTGPGSSGSPGSSTSGSSGGSSNDTGSSRGASNAASSSTSGSSGSMGSSSSEGSGGSGSNPTTP